MSGSKEYFDAVGAGWDEMRRGFFSEAVREHAIALAAVGPGSVAADLGAGTGFVTEGLVARGASVIAVDESAAMLEALADKFPPNRGVETRLGEADELPVESSAVDFAFANMYLHHVEHPAQAIREMTRILRPGGRLVITDLDAHEFRFLAEEHHDRWMGFQREAVREWLQGAGLEGVDVTCAGQDCCATSTGGQEARISIFLATGVKPDGEIREERP